MQPYTNMNMNMNTPFNPIIPAPTTAAPMMNASFAPQMHVVRVNGQAGARNVRMAPNSDALLLDETASIVWYAQTDGTGYLTVTPFDVFPHQTQAPVNLNDLSERVTKLEEALANVQQSNIGIAKQPKKQRQPITEPATSATT